MTAHTLALLGLLATLAPAGVTLAAESALPPAIRACAAEKDDTRRLACFDDAVARAPAVESAAAGAHPPAPAPVAPTKSPEQQFGLPKEEHKAAIKGVEGIVTKVAVKPHGELVVTLDNGQVWTEIATETGVRVKVGDRVKISSGSLGSFRISAPNGRSSPVRRVQ